jgi:hypothetical protein
LVALDRLPLSLDGRAEEGFDSGPEHDVLPVTYLARGRGALAVLAAVGLLAFFLPWVHLTLPDVVDYSGANLGRRIGWPWGAGVAWFVLLPTVVSRRSVAQMRGARVAAAFLSAIPGVTAAVLLARPPHATHGVPMRFAFEPAFFATIALSAVALAIAFVLGGSTRALPARRGSSRGEVLH